MLLFIVFVVGALSLRPRHTYSEWHAWIGRPGVLIAGLLGMAAWLLRIL